MMTQIDELWKKRHLEMSFVEFIEALSRVCSKVINKEIKLNEKLMEVMPRLLQICPISVKEVFTLPTFGSIERMKYRAPKMID